MERADLVGVGMASSEAVWYGKDKCVLYRRDALAQKVVHSYLI